MTCRLSPTDWRDVLYNTVRGANGGVKAAAAFLADRRGVSIHSEYLRARLRGVDGQWVNVEVLELLTEWLQEIREPNALQWLQTLSIQHGMVTMELPPPPAGGWPCEITAIREKLLQASVKKGVLTHILTLATADHHMTVSEAEEADAQIMDLVMLLLRLRRNVRRSAGLEVQ